MFLLSHDLDDIRFPSVDAASPEGLVAIGGDLRPERLIEAYRNGIFPWYSDGQPILWWSPEKRTLLFLDQLKVSQSLRKTIRQQRFRVTMDQCFERVIHACAQPRDDREAPGTWITGDMIDAYVRLHEMGLAHSVECWRDKTLAGGLYGVTTGRAFCGESMFHRASDASKVALVHLVQQLRAWQFHFIDCQMPSAHLSRLGAVEVERAEFLRRLDAALRYPDKMGEWEFDTNLRIDQ